MDNSYINLLVEMTFEEVEQADKFSKVVRKNLDKSIMKILKIKRTKNVFKMICKIETEEDWKKVSLKDLENLKPDAIKFENLSEKDREKAVEACEGLEDVSMKIDMRLDLT